MSIHPSAIVFHHISYGLNSTPFSHFNFIDSFVLWKKSKTSYFDTPVPWSLHVQYLECSTLVVQEWVSFPTRGSPKKLKSVLGHGWHEHSCYLCCYGFLTELSCLECWLLRARSSPRTTKYPSMTMQSLSPEDATSPTMLPAPLPITQLAKKGQVSIVEREPAECTNSGRAKVRGSDSLSQTRDIIIISRSTT